ncbi:MAG: Mur ligase domain-containing protein, partial [Thermomicrobiales bacterium]
MTEPGYQPPIVIPPPPASIHFVGIGGIGMSGLARIFLSRGYAVSGSDAMASPQTEALEAIGIPVMIGHNDIGRAGRADLVVATSAVSGVNAEIDAAKRANRPIVKRAAALGALANGRVNVAVAGSHGKSTTSG